MHVIRQWERRMRTALQAVAAAASCSSDIEH